MYIIPLCLYLICPKLVTSELIKAEFSTEEMSGQMLFNIFSIKTWEITNEQYNYAFEFLKFR